MTQEQAGGLKTQQDVSPRIERLLEDNVERLNGAVAELLAHARSVDPDTDLYGHARSRAYDDALNLMKATDKLGHTLAELRGTKFDHNINVRREQVVSSMTSASGRQVLEEEDGEDDRGPDVIWLSDEKLFDWRRRQTFVLESKDSGRDPVPAGDPPPKSEGSNGNFGGAGEAAKSQG